MSPTPRPSTPIPAQPPARRQHCDGAVWVGWRYRPCQNDATHQIGEQAFCALCAGLRRLHPPPPDLTEEIALARTQLAARLADRLAEQMGWGSLRGENGEIHLTPEQAAELIERLEGGLNA